MKLESNFKFFFVGLTLTLSSCKCVSIQEQQPYIANGGCARIISQHPTAEGRMMVVSENGGIFIKRDKWRQISRNASWHFSDAHYYTPLAVVGSYTAAAWALTCSVSESLRPCWC